MSEIEQLAQSGWQITIKRDPIYSIRVVLGDDLSDALHDAMGLIDLPVLIESIPSFEAYEKSLESAHTYVAEQYRKQRASGCPECIQRARSLRGPCAVHA